MVSTTLPRLYPNILSTTYYTTLLIHPILKFPQELCYYTDGSFIPPKQIDETTWISESAAYDIYNAHKNLEISNRLPGLQNILRAELMALYDTLKLSIEHYNNEPMHIFTDSLNSLYLLNTQIMHPSQHTNHPDKTILSEMVQMLQRRTHILTLHKVRTHSNITRNDKADELAKAGHESEHRWPLSLHTNTPIPLPTFSTKTSGWAT